MQTLKQSISRALESNDLETVVISAKENRKVLSLLIRLAYNKDTLVGWRAIKAIGLAARAIVSDQAFLRETIRKLLWSLSDESGGIGWSAPEIIGEIVSADPEGFKDIIPLIAEVYDIEEKVFRPGVMYALGRIAEASIEHVLPFKEVVKRGLGDPDPTVRVYAVNLAAALISKLGKSDQEYILQVVKSLQTDNAEVWIYRNDCFLNIQVKEKVRKLRGSGKSLFDLI